MAGAAGKVGTSAGRKVGLALGVFMLSGCLTAVAVQVFSKPSYSIVFHNRTAVDAVIFEYVNDDPAYTDPPDTRIIPKGGSKTLVGLFYGRRKNRASRFELGVATSSDRRSVKLLRLTADQLDDLERALMPIYIDSGPGGILRLSLR